MIEVELKYRIDDVTRINVDLNRIGATSSDDPEQHEDIYFNHPSRDFAETKEALRVRRIDGRPWMTYKGVKLPGAVKARREIEVAIGGDPESGREFEDALELMGFRRVATVRKLRQSHQWCGPDAAETLSIAVDSVDELGDYVEIECVAADDSTVDACHQNVVRLANRLGLQTPEPRSYLTLLLASRQEKH